jgi:hypothetical protein
MHGWYGTCSNSLMITPIPPTFCTNLANVVGIACSPHAQSTIKGSLLSVNTTKLPEMRADVLGVNPHLICDSEMRTKFAVVFSVGLLPRVV